MPVKEQLSRRTSLPPCLLDVEALERIHDVLPADFRKTWQVTIGPRRLEAKSITELAKEVPDWSRVDTLELRAHRTPPPGELSIDKALEEMRSDYVTIAVTRHVADLYFSSDLDPGSVVLAEEAILTICRDRRTWWSPLATGWLPWALFAAGILSSLGWAVGIALWDRSHAAAISLWVLAAVGAIAALPVLLNLPTRGPVRLIGRPQEKVPLVQWRQVLPSFIGQLTAGLVLLAVGIVIGRACQ